MGDTDTSPGLLAIAQVAPIVVKNTSVSSTVTIDTYANRLTAVAAGSGSIFYASDQVALYLSNGAAWLRIGPSMPGDIIWTNEAVTRPGYVLLTGQAWPATNGIYTELFGLWGGANLPDVQARTFAAKGTHVDMATMLGNEGVATVVNRRQKHQTSLVDPGHFHTLGDGTGGANRGGGLGSSVDHTGSAATGITVGTGVGTDPVDSGAYIVLQPQAKL